MHKNRKLMQIAVSAVFLGIIVFINLIFNRLNISFDLTENELYSISDEARSITGKLDRDIDVYCFVEDENKASVICEFTRRFCETSTKLNCRIVNPVKQPQISKRYTTDAHEISENTVVFDNGEDYKVISYEDMLAYNYLTGQNNLLVAEERFSQALMALDKDTVAKIAFLIGHGETADESLGKRVENMGADFETVDIRNEEFSDFDIAMIISPQIDFTSQEIKKLDSFLDDGGTVIVSVDASVPELEMLDKFLFEWGIVVERNMVFSTDNKSIIGNQPYSVIGKLNSHPVTDGLIKNNIAPVFFASRGLVPVWEAQDGKTVTILAQTTEKATAVSIDTKEEDKSGVFSLLTLSQGEKGRIFTFGSNMFFSEELKVYNQDLLRNIITWSSDGELMTDVWPKVITSSNIQVPKSSIVLWIVIFGIMTPAVVIVIGIIVAVRRRKL